MYIKHEYNPSNFSAFLLLCSQELFQNFFLIAPYSMEIYIIDLLSVYVLSVYVCFIHNFSKIFNSSVTSFILLGASNFPHLECMV